MTTRDERLRVATACLQGLLAKYGYEEGHANVVTAAVGLANDLMNEIGPTTPKPLDPDEPGVEVKADLPFPLNIEAQCEQCSQRYITSNMKHEKYLCFNCVSRQKIQQCEHLSVAAGGPPYRCLDCGVRVK